MKLENYIKFGLFVIIALIPISLGFVMFDYSKLYSCKIINEFGKMSLIAIAITYLSISILIRILMYSMTLFFKNEKIRTFANSISFMTLFYTCCFDVFIYGSIPIIITYYVKGNFISFLQNSVLVWVLIFIYWVIYCLVINKSKKVSPKG